MHRRASYIRISPIALIALLVLAGCGDDGAPEGECGNGVLELPETCDGSDLGEQSCVGLGYTAGTLRCNADCTLDPSLCHTCGNDMAEAGEDCDGPDLRFETCQSLDFDLGTVTCRADCTLDVSACEYYAECGDGVLDLGEDCEGTDLDEYTCEALGYMGGTLACGADCRFDENQCDVAVGLELCTDAGTHTHGAQGELTCYSEIEQDLWDWYRIPVQAGDCIDIFADNGVGAADLVAYALDADQISKYGLAADYSQLEEEVACSVTPWTGGGCPAASVTAVTAGDFTIKVAQWAGGGSTPGVSTCNNGLSAYTLYVAINGVDATPVLVHDDHPFY